MVLIRYTGDISPMKISFYDIVYDYWITGEVRDLDEKSAKKALETKKFVLVEEGSLKGEVKKEKADLSYDLNADGKVTNEDFALAGKVLAHSKKIK